MSQPEMFTDLSPFGLVGTALGVFFWHKSVCNSAAPASDRLSLFPHCGTGFAPDPSTSGTVSQTLLGSCHLSSPVWGQISISNDSQGTQGRMTVLLRES